MGKKEQFKGPVYELPEKVLDVRSLIQALAKNLKGRLLRGEMTKILPDGQVVVSGLALHAQLIIYAAGAGNEKVLGDVLKAGIAVRNRASCGRSWCVHCPSRFTATASSETRRSRV